LDYRTVFQHADAGDALAMRLRDRAFRVWSAAAVTLVHAYDPEVVILGGGIMKSPSPILATMQAFLDEHAWVGWGKVKVAPGQLDDSAALLGLEYLVERSIGGSVGSGKSGG
jgi:glucokinase